VRWRKVFDCVVVLYCLWSAASVGVGCSFPCAFPRMVSLSLEQECLFL
jgi:hypothetical protein